MTWRQRIVAGRKKLREKTRRDRIEEARRMAGTAAQEFPFRRLYLFGSTVGNGPLSVWSDLDIAVEGLPQKDFYRLHGFLSGQTSVPVDLKPMESLPSDVQDAIRKRGLILHER